MGNAKQRKRWLVLAVVPCALGCQDTTDGPEGVTVEVRDAGTSDQNDSPDAPGSMTGDDGTTGSPNEPDDPASDAGAADPPPPPPPPDDCDPQFLGPFCTGTVCDDEGNCEVTEDNIRILGFDAEAPEDPTPEQARQYSLQAVNAIRARTCLPPLELDDCLNRIAEEAQAANAGHGYFIANCLDAEHAYGTQCECNWTQENIGGSGGTGRTWVDGVQNPLCRMMTEPKGTGHRGNIESELWTRIGISIEYGGGAFWYHEFGCDPSLERCPKD